MESTYVNAYQIFSNIYDIKIDFSVIEPSTDEKGAITTEVRVPKGRISMPLVLAKELATSLADIVREYEGKFGSIPEMKQGSKE